MQDINKNIENDKFGRIQLLDCTSSTTITLKGFNIKIELKPGFDREYLREVAEVFG